MEDKKKFPLKQHRISWEKLLENINTANLGKLKMSVPFLSRKNPCLKIHFCGLRYVMASLLGELSPPLSTSLPMGQVVAPSFLRRPPFSSFPLYPLSASHVNFVGRGWRKSAQTSKQETPSKSATRGLMIFSVTIIL